MTSSLERQRGTKDGFRRFASPRHFFAAATPSVVPSGTQFFHHDDILLILRAYTFAAVCFVKALNPACFLLVSSRRSTTSASGHKWGAVKSPASSLHSRLSSCAFLTTARLCRVRTAGGSAPNALKACPASPRCEPSSVCLSRTPVCVLASIRAGNIIWPFLPFAVQKWGAKPDGESFASRRPHSPPPTHPHPASTPNPAPPFSSSSSRAQTWARTSASSRAPSSSPSSSS